MFMGVISGSTGMLRTFLGGYLSDRLGKHDKRWYVRIALWGLALSLPLSYYTLLGSEPLYVILAYIPAHILNTLYLGPCIAICHTLVVGALSDAYIPIFGEENLRYAMLTALTMGTSGVFFSWMAHRTLLADISKTDAALTGTTATS